MSKRVDRDPGAWERCDYNFDEAERVIKAMDRLRKQAVITGIPEIVTIVDATFALMLTAYHCIVRYEMEELPATDG